MKINYLTLEQIIVIHYEIIIQFGGSDGIRDLALLESALYRPQSTFQGNDLYPTLFDKAAALIHSIILNHPFIDGNKRTGMLSGLQFLEENNIQANIDNEELVNVTLKIESKQFKIQDIATWLEKNSI